MINKILTCYTAKLENFLENVFHQPEGIVKLSNINGEGNGDILNRLVVALLNIERETTIGMGEMNVKNGTGGFSRGLPLVSMNLNVVFAAVYDSKRYADSLSVLSAVILFLQANPVFSVSGKQKYTVEIVTLSSQELNNIWSCMGGAYYPSVVCKIRGLIFDTGEIRGTSGQAGKPEVGTEKKS